MKFGIIGTINRDSVLFPDNTKKEGWGGALYNLVTLSKLAKKNDEIVPVCNVGSNCFRQIESILNQIPNLSTDYIIKVEEKNNHCFLTYHNNENKGEILRGGVPALKYDDVEPLLDCDMVLMNYLSGKDIYLKSLQKFRENYKGIIYIDIHSLTLGKRKNGARYFRVPTGWPKVVESGDYIQMNKQELALLSKSNDASDIELNLKSLIRLLNLGKIDISDKVFVITDGRHGCHLYYKYRNKFVFKSVPVKRQFKTGDTTGCGDCFSAGFIYDLAQNKSLIECAEGGNRAAVSRIRNQSKSYDILKSW